MRRPAFFALAALLAACDCSGGDPVTRLRAELTVTPSSLDFGEIAIGNDRFLDLTFKNSGEIAITVSSVAVEGTSFSLLGSDTFSLAPLEERQLAVRFAPAALGRFEGTVTIEAGEAPVTVPLVGVGVEPAIEVATSGSQCGNTARSISFGGVPVGGLATQSVTLRSIGMATTTLLGAHIESSSGELTVMGSVAQIPPGATLAIEVKYQPVDVGNDTGTLVIETDAVGASEIRVPLCAIGTRAGLCGMPVPIDVGRVALGATAQVPFELKNCGNQGVDVTAVSIANASLMGLEATPPGLPQNLAPNASMSITVRFTPTALGALTAQLAVQTAAGSEPFPIVGRAVEPCDLTPLPSSVNFGTVAAGATAQRTVVMVNETGTACTMERAEITLAGGTFTLLSPPSLPRAVPPGGSETLTVLYAPASAQASSGILEVAAGRSVRRVPLTGNSPIVPGCHLDASPSPLAFGIVGVGTSAMRTLTIQNTSQSDCHITSSQMVGGSDPGFMDPSIGTRTISAGQSITVNVTYQATQGGSGIGSLRISSDDTTTPQLDVPLRATAQGPGICVMPRRLSFGNVQGSRDLTFQIVACGSGAVTVNGLPFSRMNSQFTLVNPPATPLTIGAGATQLITVRYTPTNQQGATAAIDVASNDPVSPSITVDLEGGAQIVPPTAGRFLYFWRVTGGLFGSGGDVMRLPLQGVATAQPYWGVSTGKPCSGCHALSPDGRYLGLINSTANFSVEVVDTRNDQRVNLGFTVDNALLISWRPDVNSVPPYQFAFDDGERILIASATGGLIGTLQGTDTPGFKNKMPSWGPNGKIAFVRGAREATPLGVPAILGFGGTSDVMLVDETGGNATPLAGASGNRRLNFYPSHSPNGNWIALTQSSGASTYAAADATLAVVAADNSGATPSVAMINNGGTASFPTWSHDGTFISFSSNRAGGLGDWDIWFAPTDPITGAAIGAPMNLREANTNGFDHVARWSP